MGGNFTGQPSGTILPRHDHVHCDYKPKRHRKAKPAVELPGDAALAASHGGQSREQPQAASRDLAQRTQLIRRFMERTLKGSPPSADR